MSTDSAPGTARGWWLLPASFAVCLVALAPAALLEWAAGGAVNAKSRFAADSGTIWSGRGRIALGADASMIPLSLQWRFDPMALAGLRLGFFVAASAPALSGTAHVGFRFGDIELRDTAIDADVRLLSLAHGAAALFAPAGKLRLRQAAGERLSVRPAANDRDPWHAAGSMGVIAERLAFGGINSAQTGTHELKLRGDGWNVNVSILQSSGPLKLEGVGNIALNAPRRFTFSGFATAATDAPPALKQLGPALADGRQRIELNTPW